MSELGKDTALIETTLSAALDEPVCANWEFLGGCRSFWDRSDSKYSSDSLKYARQPQKTASSSLKHKDSTTVPTKPWIGRIPQFYIQPLPRCPKHCEHLLIRTFQRLSRESGVCGSTVILEPGGRAQGMRCRPNSHRLKAAAGEDTL